MLVESLGLPSNSTCVLEAELISKYANIVDVYYLSVNQVGSLFKLAIITTAVFFSSHFCNMSRPLELGIFRAILCKIWEKKHCIIW